MYDVMAIGNALVDQEYVMSDEQLAMTNLTKGNMTLASSEEQAQLLNRFKEQKVISAKKAGGGSAANAMYAFASLGESLIMRAALVMIVKGVFICMI